MSSLAFVSPPKLLASKGREDREVYIASAQGDVRISRGKDHRPDLNQPWEQALAGDLIQEGCALATGDGRAEIEFENGSTVYLAENSLLLFKDLGAPGDRIVSSISLVSGMATFFLQPVAHESYFIETPTDRLSIPAPESFFARVEAFLDGTAITPQGEKGETLERRGRQDFAFKKGQTLLLQGGIVERLSSSEGRDTEALIPGGARMPSTDWWELVLSGLPDFQLPSMASSLKQKREMGASLANRPPSIATEWDVWVCARQARRSAATGAALKASGLSSPIPGLADLYEHGTFFNCEPYGTCWEATDPAEDQDSASQSAAPGTQSPAQAQTNPPFQPQTVQWEELVQGWCSPATLRTVTRVAHTPEELQKLERRKAAAQKARYSPFAYASDCENGYWIPYRHHYARVVTPQRPRHCEGAKCKPIHPPRPVVVRLGSRIGFVPAHPKDTKGKPPINLKEGILVPPSKPGERTERVAVEPSQRVTVLDKGPREFRGEIFNQSVRVSEPVIHAHLVQDAGREISGALFAHPAPPITYDYKSHQFLMPAPAVERALGSRGVPVGGIDSHGRIGSFADGHSTVYAQSFARSEAAGSYRGGLFNSGGYGSGYSGGGHGSSYSSGSYSSGSHSSGSSSSGGSSSHSSGGGGGWSSGGSSASSGGSSSSSSSSSGGGGGSHGRP